LSSYSNTQSNLPNHLPLVVQKMYQEVPIKLFWKFLTFYGDMLNHFKHRYCL